ncbi:MAG: hypothetical protein ACRC7I_12290 [Selenomonadaceae bacterium]
MEGCLPRAADENLGGARQALCASFVKRGAPLVGFAPPREPGSP